MNSETSEGPGDFTVVMNHEHQYSIWPVGGSLPGGWHAVGKQGPKDECLAYIGEVWTDMRPLSLRRSMDEARPGAAQSVQPQSDVDVECSLVTRLLGADHAVEYAPHSLDPLDEAIKRGVVHIRFGESDALTELPLRVDAEATDTHTADFVARTGRVHLEGDMTLDKVDARCVVNIDVGSLKGTGRLWPSLKGAPEGDRV